MKKILTAIGNPILNVSLKKENEFEVMAEDIQYQDGIFEFLEKEKNINFLILSELIPGNLDIKKLIDKIKLINSSIQIILFLANENKEIENYLYAKGVNYIFYNNQIEIKDVIQIIKTDKNNETLELKQKIIELKKMLEDKNDLEEKNKFSEQNKISIKNKTETKNEKQEENKIEEKNEKANRNLIYLLNNKIKEKLIKNINKNFFRKKKIKEKTEEIICINGTSGIGKSIFTVNLAKAINKNKILIIDFDILNNSLHTILGVKKYSEKIINKIENNSNEINIQELIIKINSKIDLVSGVNFLINSKHVNNSIKNILDVLSQKYDVIIIDTSSEIYLDYTKEIMKLCKFNIFISGANLLEIAKTKKLLNIYVNKWKISRRNFNILFNKYDFNSIDFSILKNIFSEFNILGKLYTSSNYNLIINKNKSGKLNKKLQKEYWVIYKNLMKINNKDFNY